MFKENLVKERHADFSEATPELQVLLRLKKQIDLNFKSNKNANFYIEALREDAFKLNRIVMEYTGKTVHELIGERVIQEAEAMLVNAWPLKDIALLLGFSRTSYFINYVNKFPECNQILKRVYENNI